MRARFLVACIVLSASAAQADVVTEWNEITQNTVVARPDPWVQGRTGAIAQLAVFEAVNSITGDYQPYLQAIPAPREASPEAAAVSAAHRVLITLIPERAAELDARLSASLSTIAEGAAKSNGIAVGHAAADAILATRANDGTDTVVPYTPGSEPGDWQPTPPDLIPAFRPGLGRVTPFAIRSGKQFRVDPPPALHSNRYRIAYQEVKRLGELNSKERTQHQTDIARYYHVTDAQILWNIAARQVAEARGSSLSENARAFALLAISMMDAAIACFDTKYAYNLWRPVTAIRAADRDGNPGTRPDPNWQPLVDTPPFPAYVSGHGSIGAAARRALEHLFGAGGHSIALSSPALPGVKLHYTSWKQITDDIADARVYGGVHWRFDQDQADEQGRRVGEHVVERQLLPRGREDCDDDRNPKPAGPATGT
jgi:hypothetical protein